MSRSKTNRFWLATLIVVTMLVGLVGSAAAQEPDALEAAVEGFYNGYLSYDDSFAERRSPLSDRAYRESEYLTADLIAHVDDLLDNAGKTGFNYDPFLCAQDEPRFYAYEVVGREGPQAEVLLRTFFGSPRSNNLLLTLVQEDETWLIDGVSCEETVTPRGVTEAFYNAYLGEWAAFRRALAEGEQPDANPLLNGLWRRELVTAELAAEIDAALAADMPGGGDPLLCAQDIPATASVFALDQMADTATMLVEMRFQGNPAPHRLTVSLVQEAGAWRIADIACEVGPEAIAALLYTEYAEQVRYNFEQSVEMDILRNPVWHWNRLVSPALLERLAVQAESGELRADPVLCAQDIPARFDVTALDVGEATAALEVGGYFPSGPETFDLAPLTVVTLAMQDGAWVLTDITCQQ